MTEPEEMVNILVLFAFIISTFTLYRTFQVLSTVIKLIPFLLSLPIYFFGFVPHCDKVLVAFTKCLPAGCLLVFIGLFSIDIKEEVRIKKRQNQITFQLIIKVLLLQLQTILSYDYAGIGMLRYWRYSLCLAIYTRLLCCCLCRWTTTLHMGLWIPATSLVLERPFVYLWNNR